MVLEHEITTGCIQRRHERQQRRAPLREARYIGGGGALPISLKNQLFSRHRAYRYSPLAARVRVPYQRTRLGNMAFFHPVTSSSSSLPLDDGSTATTAAAAVTMTQPMLDVGSAAASAVGDVASDLHDVLQYRVREAHHLRHLIQFMTWAEFIVYVVFVLLVIVAILICVSIARQCLKKRASFVPTRRYGSRS